MWRRAFVLAFGLFLLPTVAFADTWSPGPHAQGESSIVGFIDYPTADTNIEQGDQLTILGWVVDSTAVGWTGIDEVHVYRGSSTDQFLGRASYGSARTDVAEHFGNSSWKNSGFNLTVDTDDLSTGDHLLTIFAHTPSKGWWLRSFSIEIQENTSEDNADDEEEQEERETVTWKTPHGHNVTTESSIEDALSTLAETAWGNWALDVAADKGLEVLWSNDIGDRFSYYQYGSRTILLNQDYDDAEERAIAAAIAHELQHALDDTYGWASWRAVTCLDLEARAFLVQASAWNSFYGPFGKVQPQDQLEEAHNAVLNSVSVRPESWLDDATSKYDSPCS